MTAPAIRSPEGFDAPGPTPGRWYFGVHSDGSTGALMQWDGFAFRSSLSDDHDASAYAYLQEQPPRA